MARRNIEIYRERILLESKFQDTLAMTRIMIEIPQAELAPPPPLMSGIMHTAATIGPLSGLRRILMMSCQLAYQDYHLPN